MYSARIRKRVPQYCVIIFSLLLLLLVACSKVAISEMTKAEPNSSEFFTFTEMQFMYEGKSLLDQAVAITVCGEKIVLLTEDAQSPDATLTGGGKRTLFFFDLEGKICSKIDVSDILDFELRWVRLSSNWAGDLFVFGETEPAASSGEKNYAVLTVPLDETKPPVTRKFKLPADFSVYSVGFDETNHIYLASIGRLLVLDESGNLTIDLSSKNFTGQLYFVGQQAYLAGEQVDAKQALYPVDLVQKKVGVPVFCPKTENTAALISGKDGLYAINNLGIFGMSADFEKATAVLLWANCDIDRVMDYSSNTFILSKDVIFTVATDRVTGEAIPALLQRTSIDREIDKEVITLAGLGVTSDSLVMSAVYSYNKNHEDYRIQVKDYSLNATGDDTGDWIYARQQLILDVISGKGPDILYSINGYAKDFAANYFLDLNSMMQKDSQFDKTDYLENIFQLCESNGELHQVCPSFSVVGLLGKEFLTQNRSGWTIEDFEAFASRLPAGMVPLKDVSQTTLLVTALQSSPPLAEVSDKSLVDLLTYVKQYGYLDDGQYSCVEDPLTMFKDGSLALMPVEVQIPKEFSTYSILFKDAISITGYPAITTSSPLCQPKRLFSITKTCRNEVAAWEFLKLFLEEDLQLQMCNNRDIPILKTIFEAQIDAAMHPADKSKIAFESAQVDFSLVLGVTAGAMTDAEAADYREFINSVKNLSYYDTNVFDIVLEEAAAYFVNDKTADEVVKLMKNRLKNYFDE